jgi:glycosyltransferase involved in cell wall biosynthesis
LIPLSSDTLPSDDLATSRGGRVFLVGYEHRPAKGSEPAIAARWAESYARAGREVVVVTHAREREFEGDEAKPYRMLYVDGSSRAVGEFPASTLGQASRRLIDINAWVQGCRRLLHAEVGDSDLVHHVSWGSARLPTPLVGLDATTVWGPLGGGQRFPWKLVRPSAEGAMNAVRNVNIAAAGSVGRFRKRLQGLDLVLATNHETLDLVRGWGASRVELMLSDGTRSANIGSSRSASPRNELRLLSAGRLVHSKRVDLAIRLTRELRSLGIRTHLNIAGDGPEAGALSRLVADLDVQDSVTFHGWMAHNNVRELMGASDLLVFMSFKDSSFPAVLEAASRGLPSIAVAHQGVGAFMSDAEAVLVAPGADAVMLYSAVRGVQRHLVDDVGYREMSRRCIEFAYRNTWDSKVGRVMDMAAWRRTNVKLEVL